MIEMLMIVREGGKDGFAELEKREDRIGNLVYEMKIKGSFSGS